MIRKTPVIILGLLLTASVWARNPEGVLDLIQTPHEGQPALAAKAKSFEVTLRSKADLRIEHEGATIPLSTQWREIRGMWHGICQLPEDAPEGTYALAAETNGQTDRNLRSVFIYAAFPESYRIAHLTDIHVGDNRDAGHAIDFFRKAVETVNASDAAFAVITGDLTHTSDPEEYRQFLEVLNTCTKPTFLAPGNHDREKKAYERYFAQDTYTFGFGPDAYLAYDTKDIVIAGESGVQDADLEVFRRTMGPARWTIGFTHRYVAAMGMRAQLTLFIDSPLDYLIVGHTHRANEDSEKNVPWGTTPFTMTPAAVDGYWRLFEISSNGIKPQPPQRFL